MPAVEFKAPLFTISSWLILKLPKEASAQLPSRSQVMVAGTLNGIAFQAPLEPDGRGSHWLHVDEGLQKAAKLAAGDTVTATIEPVKEWPEPTVPPDVQAALDANPWVRKQWTDITPMSRWEWLRWINSTLNPETRRRRIEVSSSKLMHGSRRPCCFNRSLCCVPEVSKTGMLLEPTDITT
jgi:hypothetical protein